MNNMDNFIHKFNEVRNMGFVNSNRSNNTGVGKTFEDLMGVVENNRTDPDLFGFEIKTQRSLSGSYVTLFTKSPTFPKGANNIIKQKYGYIEDGWDDQNIKKIHTSLFSNKITKNEKSGYSFSIDVDINEEKIYIVVYGDDNIIIDRSIYYSFAVIEKSLSKIENLAYIFAHKRIHDNVEQFHFAKAILYSGFKGFDFFINEIKKGNIMYDIRIGSYKSGSNFGKAHDHGSGFRIKKELISSLYEKSCVI